MSSRNAYLDEAARQRATALSAALRDAQRLLATGNRSGPDLAAAMQRVIEATPGVELDYAAVVDPATLDPVEIVKSEARALIAARVAGVRLIDNAPLVPTVL